MARPSSRAAEQLLGHQDNFARAKVEELRRIEESIKKITKELNRKEDKPQKREVAPKQE